MQLMATWAHVRFQVRTLDAGLHFTDVCTRVAGCGSFDSVPPAAIIEFARRQLSQPATY